MLSTARPRIKICCIASVEEARLAIHYGAAAIGLVSEMPSGPGAISEDLIAEIAANVPPPIATFLLTSKQNVDEIISQQRRCQTNTIQLCDCLVKGTFQDLKAALSGIKIVQVIHVKGSESIKKALAVANQVDAVLLDSGDPHLPVKRLGGTGQTHNWSISRRIRELLDIPVFLAGGINAGNLRQAVEEVGPFGIDLCSGVRTAQQLDEAKLRQFFREVNQIFFPTKKQE
jgi:phosphoribosylanthranilate isomerase